MRYFIFIFVFVLFGALWLDYVARLDSERERLASCIEREAIAQGYPKPYSLDAWRTFYEFCKK